MRSDPKIIENIIVVGDNIKINKNNDVRRSMKRTRARETTISIWLESLSCIASLRKRRVLKEKEQ